MNYSVRILAYISPLLLGLIIPFLLVISPYAYTGLNGVIRIVICRISIPVGIIVFVIGALNIIYPSDSFPLTAVNFLYLTIFLWTWALMVGGAGYLLRALGMNRVLMGVIIFILIILINTTVFYVNPLLGMWQSNAGARQWLIKLVMNINPMLTIAGAFFSHDLLRSKIMYSLCDIGPYYFYTYANWGIIIFCYFLLGAITFSIAILASPRLEGHYDTNR